MNIKQQIIASCIVLAGSVFAFDAALTDPLAWLYADSKIATAERLDEVDVPANGVVDVNILVNGLKPGERLEFDASEKGGELMRPALIPWVSVMWDVDGFLHWGYNRWQRNQGQDPFKEPYPKSWGGSNNGNSLPSGDTHIVYPGKDGPWPSARLEATRAGMEDADLLTMLRRRDRAKADALVHRIARGFQDYTPSCKLYREVRRDILRALSH